MQKKKGIESNDQFFQYRFYAIIIIIVWILLLNSLILSKIEKEGVNNQQQISGKGVYSNDLTNTGAQNDHSWKLIFLDAVVGLSFWKGYKNWEKKKVQKKKGQAATEFMMTYGWVILAVLISIGALTYALEGKDAFIPSRCVVSSSLFCEEFEVYLDQATGHYIVELVIRNRSDTMVTEFAIASAMNDMTCTTYGNKWGVAPTAIPSGDAAVFNLDCIKGVNNPLVGKSVAPITGFAVQKFRGDFTFSYKNAGSTLTRTVRGTIISKSADAAANGIRLVVVNPTTHLECVNQECVAVAGAGADLCKNKGNCESEFHKKHLACVNQACVNVDGAGEDSCKKDEDCIISTHLECVDESCVSVNGAGSDLCKSANDCIPKTHLECVNQACIAVTGSGTDLCKKASDCKGKKKSK